MTSTRWLARLGLLGLLACVGATPPVIAACRMRGGDPPAARAPQDPAAPNACGLGRTAPHLVETASLGNAVNVHRCGDLYLAGQFEPRDVAALNEAGIRRVVTLRTEGEIDWDEAALLQEAGIELISLPFRSADDLTDAIIDRARQALVSNQPLLLHCATANRVGAVWLTRRVLDEHVSIETALAEAREIGLRSESLEAAARHYIERRREPTQDPAPTISPDLNKEFLNPNLVVEDWLKRFEVESREIFTARHEILKAVDPQSGQKWADIGAGTGLFTRLFADSVGQDGHVYAVEISTAFLQHISRAAREEGRENVSPVLGALDHISLPAQSIDAAFVCDTYHHFEFPTTTLQSIHRALRPGGKLVVVDFERIPGVSRDWVLNHVRAGRERVAQEITAAGFELVDQVDVAGLHENYLLVFRKPEH